MASRNVGELGQRLRAVFALDTQAIAIETKRGRTAWRELAEAAQGIEHTLEGAGVDCGAPVGWVARNRPAAVAACAGLIMNGRMVVPLRPRQTSATLGEEIIAQKLQAVIGDEEDWADQDVIAAARDSGTLGIATGGISPLTVRVIPTLGRIGPGPHRSPMPGYVLERLTSGTTGAPKRIAVSESVLVPSLESGARSGTPGSAQTLRLKNSPAILLKPFSHAGGLFGLLLALYQARPMVLFERFVVSDWAEAVARYRPKSASLVPAMIRMIVDADIPKAALASLKAVRSGTAPLDTGLQRAFEERYDIPILVDYGAAEFIGGIAGWTLEDHHQFGAAKRGSVGRSRPDVHLKITDEGTGAELPCGRLGILHVKCDRFGLDWFRTNDLALIDQDGFLFLQGRADDAINRGGFKILPDEVAAVLRRYPGVRDAAVIGRPDVRLGQVPVAAIEMTPGAVAPQPAQLEAFAREKLTSYMIPKEFHFVDELPRTASMKVCRPELKRLLSIE